MTRFWIALLFCTVPLGCGGGGSSPTAPSPSDRPFLRFDAGGRSTGVDGQAIELTPENSVFQANVEVADGIVNSFTMRVDDRNGTIRMMWIGAPDGQQLVPGRYTDAVLDNNQERGYPELKLITYANGIAGCGRLPGSNFTVLEAHYGAPPPRTSLWTLDRFRATFVLRCTSGDVRGEVNIPQPLH